MQDNMYAPPQARLDESENEGTSFRVVGISKHAILFFSTMGLYTIYWFYANWQTYRTHTGKQVWPWARAFFSIFFTHSLFSNVQARLDEKKLAFAWNAGNRATLYVVIALMTNLLDRMAFRGVGSPFSDILGIAFLPVLFYTLLIPQRAINVAEDDPTGASNSRLTTANYIWILLGGVLWVATLYGLQEPTALDQE